MWNKIHFRFSSLLSTYLFLLFLFLFSFVFKANMEAFTIFWCISLWWKIALLILVEQKATYVPHSLRSIWVLPLSVEFCSFSLFFFSAASKSRLTSCEPVQIQSPIKFLRNVLSHWNLIVYAPALLKCSLACIWPMPAKISGLGTVHKL